MPLVDGIDAWGGIDGWGAVNLDTATPNLEAALLAALDDLAPIAVTQGAADIAEELRGNLEAATGLADENRLLVNPARVDAVKSAAQQLTALLTAQGAGGACDPAALDEALALDGLSS